LSGCSATAANTNDTTTFQTTSVIADIIPTLQTEEIKDPSVNWGIQNLNGTTLCLPTDELPFDYQMAENLLEEWSRLKSDLMITSFEHLDRETIIEVEGITYNLLDPSYADGWRYYENWAKDIFTDHYVNNFFTPIYTERLKLFYEQEGKLYRQAADGIEIGNLMNSMHIWHEIGDVYYLSVKTSSEETDSFRIFQVILDMDAKYQFKINNIIDFQMGSIRD
jgi:hypothetical protein